MLVTRRFFSTSLRDTVKATHFPSGETRGPSTRDTRCKSSTWNAWPAHAGKVNDNNAIEQIIVFIFPRNLDVWRQRRHRVLQCLRSNLRNFNSRRILLCTQKPWQRARARPSLNLKSRPIPGVVGDSQRAGTAPPSVFSLCGATRPTYCVSATRSTPQRRRARRCQV